MDPATGAMRVLLPMLGKFLNEEYNLQKSAKQDLQYLQRELQSMNAALTAVGEVLPDELSAQDRLWASDVRQLSHEIQDLVESFLLSAARATVPPDGAGRFKVLKVELNQLISFVTMAKARREIASAVKDIKGKVTEVANRDERYRGRGNVSAVVPAAAAAIKITVDPLLAVLYDNTKKVGLDSARDKIIKILLEGDSVSKREPKILSIVGFGGLGKTTLAKVVYDILAGGFDYTAFVPVSRNPDVRKVLKDLLFDLDQNKYNSLNLADLDGRQLIHHLRESLGTKRCFIVIDDIWDTNAWETIRLAFMGSNCGSRIITTTRNVDVAKACSSYNDDHIHKMEPLSVEDSKNLFYKRIFGSETSCPPELEQVSKDILKKCGGVPLAIITLASHLASNQQTKPKVQWLHLLKFIGRGLINDGSVDQMKKILSFSYLDLPSHLKTCLLYLSVFPEDYTIRRDRLIRRWIAEGFIQGDNLIEVGESYVNELLNRSMIEPAVTFTSKGMVEGCRVHDMMLDLLCDLSSEENLITELDDIKGDTPLQKGICRLSLRRSIRETLCEMATMNMSQVRSFSLFSNFYISERLPLSGFRLLRVLDLEDCHFGLDCYISSVGNLVHLRYLGLRNTQLGRLPEGIGKLLFLQILDLEGMHQVEWPKGAIVLTKLICMYLTSYSELPEGLSNLTSLEELTGADFGDRGHTEDLRHLTKLRVLSLIWWGREDDSLILVESLGKLQHLESLDIFLYEKNEDMDLMQFWEPSPHLHRIVLEGRLQRLPTWISSLHLLSHLDINVREVGLEDIQILGTLPALDDVTLHAWGGLNVREDRAVETAFMLSADAFPRARKCFFDDLILVPWMFAPGAMPMVKDLEFGLLVSEILSGGDLDLSTRNLPSLRKLTMKLFGEETSSERYSEAKAVLEQAAADHPNQPETVIQS